MSTLDRPLLSRIGDSCWHRAISRASQAGTAFASLQHRSLFVDDADYDSLLGEVDADVLHGILLLVEIRGLEHLSGLPRIQDLVPASTSFHSFTLRDDSLRYEESL